MLINPELFTLARFTTQQGWLPPGSIEKVAIVPPGGGDPSGGAPPGGGGAPPGGDPSGGGPPMGGAPPGGGAPPPPPGDPGAGGAAPGGPPPGPMDPAALQQIVQAVQQSMGGGGAGGPAGKGKSPKDQIQAGQMKILISLVAQMASKMDIQVDPQLLVPPTDPATDQLAMQETANASMAPSNDPNAGAGGDPAAAGGAPPSGGGGGASGPPPVQPMDPSQGPIGKAASFPRLGRALGEIEGTVGREYPIPRLRANRNKAAAALSVFRSLAREA